MTRAEIAALEAYPDYPSMDGGYVTQRKQRHCYIKGYEQAEKDIITIHLGKVLTKEQYNEVVNSVIAFMNQRWPELTNNRFSN